MFVSQEDINKIIIPFDIIIYGHPNNYKYGIIVCSTLFSKIKFNFYNNNLYILQPNIGLLNLKSILDTFPKDQIFIYRLIQNPFLKYIQIENHDNHTSNPLKIVKQDQFIDLKPKSIPKNFSQEFNEIVDKLKAVELDQYDQYMDPSFVSPFTLEFNDLIHTLDDIEINMINIHNFLDPCLPQPINHLYKADELCEENSESSNDEFTNLINDNISKCKKINKEIIEYSDDKIKEIYRYMFESFKNSSDYKYIVKIMDKIYYLLSKHLFHRQTLFNKKIDLPVFKLFGPLKSKILKKFNDPKFSPKDNIHFIFLFFDYYNYKLSKNLNL